MNLELVYPEPPPGPCICFVTRPDCPQHGWDLESKKKVIVTPSPVGPTIDINWSDPRSSPAEDVNLVIEALRRGMHRER